MAQAPDGAVIFLMKGSGKYTEGSGGGGEGKHLTIQAAEPVEIR